VDTIYSLEDNQVTRVQPEGLLNIKEGILFLDAKGKVIFWYLGAKDLLDWQSREEWEKEILSSCPGGAVAGCNSNDRDFNGYGSLKRYQLPSGEYKTFWLSFSYLPEIQGDNGPTIVHIFDVSDLMKEMEKAKRESDAKSQFLATISHEIRNPLLGILGYCDILMMDHSFHQQRESLFTLQHCANQLLELVNSMLDLSKIESQKLEVNAKEFNIKEMLNQTCSAFKPRLQSRGVELRLQVSPDVPDYIRADESKLKQVVNNLMANASKFTDSGYIEVRLEKCEDLADDYSSIFPMKISIIDTGIGISPREEKRIFEPFFRTSSPHNQKYEGNGLGLTICKRLIEIMGGNICCKPNGEKGSVFSLNIPVEIADLKRVNEDFAQYQAIPSVGEKNITVLLAEDIKVNRQLIRYMLESLGYKVITVNNGQECIEVLETARPDIILMDMQMPIMDGYAATRLLKQSSGFREIPVVALTAYAMAGDVEKCRQAGCDHYLSKPFTLNQLQTAINYCLNQEKNKDKRDLVYQ
jgi:signal transduction histidine kinase/CheY-like chemotaxis protein